MSDDKPPLNVIPGGFGKSPSGRLGELYSPEPPPMHNMTTQQRRVWSYLIQNLTAAGIPHITAGMLLLRICKAYDTWITLSKKCDEEGRFGVTEKGNSYELPHSYVERDAASVLTGLLEKACLTVETMIAARAKLGDANPQDDLFGDLVNHAARGQSA